MSFDPETQAFKVYEIGEDALYPHTVRIDQKGIVWFTIAISNQVGRFDPETETFTLLQLPHNGLWRWATDVFFPTLLKYSARTPRENKHIDLSPHKMLSGIEYQDLFNLPYGIDINPKDGGVWYAKLWANMIGHVDPDTLEVTEYETPLKGPRRPRFDADGILWIPSFDESALLRFDPTTGEFKTYPLPTLSPDEYETPYALNVDQQTGDVWMTSNMSDRILRFIPKEERFISYPSPTRSDLVARSGLHERRKGLLELIQPPCIRHRRRGAVVHLLGSGGRAEGPSGGGGPSPIGIAGTDPVK